MENGINSIKYSLGTVTYPWTITQLREFYTQVAITPEINKVYLGEVVCSKRAALINKYLPELIQLLQNANKEVYLATPLLNNDDESYLLMLNNINLAKEFGCGVEINDLSALKYASGLSLVAGPAINIYNQTALSVLARNQIKMICPPYEISKQIMLDLANSNMELEIMVFGNLPLSISSRCFTAHNLGSSREDCKLICFKHAEGVAVSSDEDNQLFMINGMQIQSAKIYNLIPQINELFSSGVRSFRINPTNLVSLKTILDQIRGINNIFEHDIYVNGFYFGKEGHLWIDN